MAKRKKSRQALEQELKEARSLAALNHLRAFEGAKRSRRTENWVTTSTGPNADIKPSLRWLISRHQDLVDNNPWCKRAIEVIVGNWIGDGIIGAPIVDAGRGRRVGEAYGQMWQRWVEGTACDFYARQNFYGLQELVGRTVATRGSVLVRRRTRAENLDLGLPPVQVQVMEPDWLDTGKDNGGSIVGGKQYSEEGRFEGYWLLPMHPGENDFRGVRGVRYQSEFIPAADMLHIFESRRPHQYTGIPWGSAILLTARDLDDVHGAEILKQKIASCFVGVEYDDDPDGTDTSEPLPDKLEPGAIERLKPGKQMTFSSPPRSESYGDLTNISLHAIAAGYGISYESLTGILSEVNFSSARMGWIEFHRNVARWRWNIAVPQLLEPVHAWFNESARLVNMARSQQRMVWTPPRRELIDPTREIPALIKSIRGGLMTLSEVQRSLGYIPEEIAAEFKADMERIDNYGLVLDCDPRADVNRQPKALAAA